MTSMPAITPEIVMKSQISTATTPKMAPITGRNARIFKAIAEADVNIRMIDQGSSELNIIIAVDECDFEKAMNAIYHEYVN